MAKCPGFRQGFFRVPPPRRSAVQQEDVGTALAHEDPTGEGGEPRVFRGWEGVRNRHSQKQGVACLLEMNGKPG